LNGSIDATPPISISAASITVVDGDTVRANGQTYRLAGFDTPESGSLSRCERERKLANAATNRLRQSCSIEGRLLETILKAEQDAAPAPAARNRRAGRPRPVVRRHYDRLPSMAGRWGDDGRRKPPWAAGSPAVCAPRKHGAGDRKAAGGAPDGDAPRVARGRGPPDASKGRRREQRLAAPFGAPPPRISIARDFESPARGPACGNHPSYPETIS
jgi:hypothetical protein